MPLPLVIGLLLARSQTEKTPLRTPSEVARALGSLGYPFSSTLPNGVSGSIRRGEAVVRVGMTVSFGPGGEREGSWVSGLDLTMEIDVPRESALADRIADESALRTTTPTRFVSHLGRTVTISKRVALGASTTPDELRAALDEYWRSGEAFARAHAARFAPAEPRDRSTDRYPDGYVLDRADSISLRRATDSWGWTARRAPSVSSNGWIFPVAVAGRSLWLREEPIDAPGHDARFRLGTVVDLPSGTDVRRWLEAAKSLLDGSEIQAVGGDAVQVERGIDLSRGVTLGTLRDRIRAFVADVDTTLKRG